MPNVLSTLKNTDLSKLAAAQDTPQLRPIMLLSPHEPDILLHIPPFLKALSEAGYTKFLTESSDRKSGFTHKTSLEAQIEKLEARRQQQGFGIT